MLFKIALKNSTTKTTKRKDCKFTIRYRNKYLFQIWNCKFQFFLTANWAGESKTIPGSLKEEIGS